VSLRLHRALTLACLMASVAVVVSAVGQEPILTFSLDETQITIPQGGEAAAILRIENASVYQGDDIEPILDIEEITLRAEPEEIEVLQPFDVATVALRLSATEEIPLGSSSHVLGILYSYCIGELCFQFFEEIPFTLTVEPPSAVPIELPVVLPVESTSPLRVRLGALGLGILLLAAAMAIRRAFSASWPLYVVLILFAMGGLAYGVVLNQHEQAQGIGAVLCTSCVGIEEAQHGEPELTPTGIAMIEGIEREIELLVFYAEWCHACPFAEAMVEEVAAHNRRITFRFIDVAEEPEMAEHSGITRSGRTVVPAILRVDTGEIVFGAEDLEARLIDLLEGES
jgi:thiol-disulfide isomerase/thioredoxin